MTSGKPAVEEALARLGRFREIRPNLKIKDVVRVRRPHFSLKGLSRWSWDESQPASKLGDRRFQSSRLDCFGI